MKRGKFSDAYRGDGYFIRFPLKHGWFLLGFRPRNWHLYFTKLPSRPAARLYVGPFEIEFCSLKP